MKIEKVWFDEDYIFIKTDTGHIVGNPVKWFPYLSKATTEQRQNFTFNDFSIRWEDIDEDLSLEGFFRYKVDTSNFTCFSQ